MRVCGRVVRIPPEHAGQALGEGFAQPGFARLGLVSLQGGKVGGTGNKEVRRVTRDVAQGAGAFMQDEIAGAVTIAGKRDVGASDAAVTTGGNDRSPFGKRSLQSQRL